MPKGCRDSIRSESHRYAWNFPFGSDVRFRPVRALKSQTQNYQAGFSSP